MASPGNGQHRLASAHANEIESSIEEAAAACWRERTRWTRGSFARAEHTRTAVLCRLG